MRILLSLVLAGLVGVSEAQAQFVYRNTMVTPTPYPGNFSYSRNFVAPFGYQSSVTTGVYPTPYGTFNAYSTATTNIRPIFSGPYHSVLWDPFRSSYRYTTGYTNSPSYSYSYTPYVYSPYPYTPYAAYPTYSPYSLSPYPYSPYSSSAYPYAPY